MSIGTKIKLMYWRIKSDPAEAINKILDSIGFAIGKAFEAREFLHDLQDEDNPKLSDEAYERFDKYLGKRKAEEVRADVESSRMGEKEAEEWSRKLELVYEHSRGRRSIEPEEWQDFEEGWRPDNW